MEEIASRLGKNLWSAWTLLIRWSRANYFQFPSTKWVNNTRLIGLLGGGNGIQREGSEQHLEYGALMSTAGGPFLL